MLRSLVNNHLGMKGTDGNLERQPGDEPQKSSPHYLILEYYQRPFALLHADPARPKFDGFLPPPIRQSFWQFVQPGEYTGQLAREYLQSYLSAVESHLRQLIESLSLAYCVHLYRRLFPGRAGRDSQLTTVGITRAILEAAIQKYAAFQFCNKIAQSAEVSIDKVLGGLLMSPEYEDERQLLEATDQLVLTNFNSSDLTDFYNLEKLAYEIWKTSAVLRAVGKGAPLFVDDRHSEYFGDARSDELDDLLTSYDSRIGGSGLTETSSGVVYTDWTEDSIGCVFLPVYNVHGVSSHDLKDFFTAYGVNFIQDFTPNFLWTPLNLRQYRIAHAPFAEAFYEKHNVTLDSALAVIAALSLRALYKWHHNPESLLRYFQRAYIVGDTELVKEDLLAFLPQACKTLGLNKSDISDSDFLDALSFWALNDSNRDDLDLAYSGPHYPILPVRTGKVFIDYAWMIRRLFDLFRYVSLPDQNFKGEALENTVSRGPSALPTKPCKSVEGEQKQIDYAYAGFTYLIIVECKAVGMSIGFDRGDPIAIKFRTENVVERALTEVDDKANWLAQHPKGSNYDITSYSHILPLAISPFVEFIPSKNPRYWLTDIIPRVLTPREFKHFLKKTPTIDSVSNSIALP